MATIAVFLVLGGTAVAATQLPSNSVGTKQIQKEAVTPAKLSKASKAALIGQAGAKGATGATGPQGPKGDPGEKGEAGLAGSALAYAQISGTGEVSHAKNISQADVVHAGTSLLCISGLSFTPDNVVASGVAPTSVILFASVALGVSGACPTGTQVTVETYDDKGAPAAGPVSVLIN
jgi:hypothetical protein